MERNNEKAFFSGEKVVKRSLYLLDAMCGLVQDLLTKGVHQVGELITVD